MLVQIALMAFALCGLLSLVIDVGYTRVTRGQMQNAADTAALEGLRKRDVGVRNPVTGQTINDAFASDCIRRASVNRIVRWTFDDNLEPADGDPDYQSGLKARRVSTRFRRSAFPTCTPTNRICSSIS